MSMALNRNSDFQVNFTVLLGLPGKILTFTQPFHYAFLSISLKYRGLPDSEYLMIKGCINGNRTSQSELYDRFAPKMLVVCMRYSRNREEAEEILHEGFYRVFKYIRQFEHKGSFEGWIRKIMVNAALQRYKSKSTLHPVIDINASDRNIPDSTDIQSDMNVKELIQLVQSLPAAYRLVFNLHVFEGFKHREIASLLGISEGTSKSNLSDARTILQKALKAKKKR